MELHFSMAAILQIDPYHAVISQIAAFGNASVSVPALSKLLGVKSATLNARFRRLQIHLRTLGRTNYLPCQQALELVELHRYALIGWPTLLAASRMTAIRPATLKARCEKGQLEGHIDLTKRLRLNPAELGQLCSVARPAETKLKSPRFEAWADVPVRKHNSRSRAPAEMKERASSAKVGVAIDIPGVELPDATSFPRPDPVSPAAPRPSIRIIGPKDYGLPELEKQPRAKNQELRPSKHAHNKVLQLVYDPLHPFSLSVCSLGYTIRYGQYLGTILGLIDDPYSPKIKVAFPDHENPAMREVLLAVEKKKPSEVLL